MKPVKGMKPLKPNKTSEKDRKEAGLIARIRAGDELALKELYGIYYGRLYRFISRINGGLSIDEIINDVLYVVWQKADTFNHSCLASTWIFGIAYNKARRSCPSGQKDLEESLDAFEVDTFGLAAVDGGIGQLETDDLLGEAFKYLSPDQRAVVELTYFHGLSYRDISKVMACSENTVKTRMFHARIKLSRAFRENGSVSRNSD